MAADRGTTADDLPHRDLTIHLLKAFDPSTAPLFSHNELLIHADCHTVFLRLTDAQSWPAWFVLTKDVRVDGPDKVVRHGSTLSLKIFDTPITARIDEWVPDSRVSWIPKADSEAERRHYHSWHFVPASGGCRVITEETGTGPDDVKRAREGNTFMHRAHDLWLASLRWTAEE